MANYIQNCIVTQSNAKILKPAMMDRTYKEYHTGVDLETKKVYSLCPGTVLQIGRDNSGYTVAIQFNNANCFQYKGFVEVYLHRGQSVDAGEHIGNVSRFVHVEYLNTQSSMWPVRIGTLTYYKHDPSDYLVNGYEPLIDYVHMLSDINNFIDSDDEDEMPDSVDQMLRGNKG